MKLHRIMAVAMCAASVAASGCGDDDGPTGPTTETFRATLNGANERPTPRTTPATGTATLTLTGDVLSWTIALQNITNVSGAHIHIGGPEESGGVLISLAGTGLNNTNISGSTNKAAFLLNPPGAPNAAITWEQIIQMMRTSGVYVNIHTSDPAKPENNTAGDFPAGEIRGQITKVS